MMPGSYVTHEGLAVMQDTVESLRKKLQAFRAIIDPLEELCSEEGASVMVHRVRIDEFENRIVVTASVMNWSAFMGDTLAEALAAAVRAKRAAEEQQETDRKGQQ
jgi:hypothetical protein